MGTAHQAIETPRIGITSSPRRPAEYYDAYARALSEAGAEPVLLTPQTGSLDGLDGLLLPGGWDVDPGLYGADREAEVGPIDPELDRAEIDLVREACEAGVPVLGICRGQQVINVALGGTLLQHLPEHDVREHGRQHLAHSIEVRPGTELAQVAGGVKVEVNSLHHQAVGEIAPGLVATATGPDGVIEGLQSQDGGIVAVQCHPEELTGALGWARVLFERFVARARAHRRQ